MNDQDKFDRQIAQSLDALPPTDVVERVTPFRRSMKRITAGLVLCLFNINILWLPHILPAIGAALLYLGFRTLRRENPRFRLCWILSAIKLPLYLLTLLFQCAPPGVEALGILLTAANCLWMLLLFIAYGAGVNAAVSGATGDGAGALGPAVSGVLWYLAMLFCALTGLGNSWLIFIPMVVWYILTARALWRHAKALDAWGYSVQAAPVRLSEGRFKLLWCAALLVVFAAGCVFLARSPVQGQSPVASQADTARLAEMGIPADILSDLTDEDIALLSQAETICLTFDDEPIQTDSFSLGHKLFENADSHYTGTVCSFVLRTADGRHYMLCHFRWEDCPALSWEEGARLSTYHDFYITNAVGRLLWEQDGETWQADMPGLTWGDHTKESLFFGTSTQPCAQAAFSYPHFSENRRGYILVEACNRGSYQSGIRFNFNYGLALYHKNQPFHLPYPDPLEMLGGNDFGYAPSRYQFWAAAQTVLP